jgi:hypothetical protein
MTAFHATEAGRLALSNGRNGAGPAVPPFNKVLVEPIASASGDGSQSTRWVSCVSYPSRQTIASCSRRITGSDPDPPSARQWGCVRLRRLDGLVGGHGAADAGKQPARGAEADARTRRLASSILFGALAVRFENPCIGREAAASLEPVQHLRRRVDLVVVTAIGETRRVVQILGEPRCGVGYMHKAVLDPRVKPGQARGPRSARACA